jgi:hypothetical protein
MVKLTARLCQRVKGQHHSTVTSSAVADESNIAAPTPNTPNSAGLDLLFAASSQVDKIREDENRNHKVDHHVATKEVPSSTVKISSDGGTKEAGDASRSEGSDTEEATGSCHAYSEAAVESPHDADVLQNQVKTFPQILQEILSTPQYQPIAHWLPDGYSFVIADKQRFSEEILPKFFREALFHSFIRKLNRWGFRRVKNKNRRKGEEGSFAHSNFVRDKPWLCMKMKCKSKPSYHKIPAAKKKSQQVTVAAANNNCIASAAHFNGLPGAAHPVPPSYSATASGLFVPAPGAAATTNSTPYAERECSTVSFVNQELLFRERQLLMAQIHQRHQLQMEILSAAYNEEVLANSYSYLQQEHMMRMQAHDMMRRNMLYGEVVESAEKHSDT